MPECPDCGYDVVSWEPIAKLYVDENGELKEKIVGYQCPYCGKEVK